MNMVDRISDKLTKKDHLDGIHCDVTNCVYHDSKHNCSASKINVGPTYAASNSDTVCSTFKPR